MPDGWNPKAALGNLDASRIPEGSAQELELQRKMRKIWDSAPVRAELDGQRIRLPGYVVPLEYSTGAIRDFLLVPYFGACIHSPPPPANQIVHVLPKTAAKGLRSMDTVWVTGVLAAVRTDSYMGVSGYRIEATQVAPYAERPAR
jgi:hypothetical protein